VKRLKGPELKMPKLKAPPFAVDLYYDLRDRRLLPLIALVVVAIAAVPFLIGGDSEEVPPVAGSTGVGAGTANPEGADASSLTVVTAKPGLRDYRKRLGRREPTDPFKQRYSGAQAKGAKLSSTTPTSSTSETTSTSTTTTTETSKTTVEPGSTGGAPGKDGGSSAGEGEPDLTLFTFAIDVQISRSESTEDGGQKMGEPTIRHRVLPATPLPGEKAPVVTYMGMNFKTERALLMVSPDVTSVFGDAKCVSGTDACQLLEVEPGFPLTFVYGPNEVRYQIKVIKIEPVARGRS
jgi:hypothetical protein